MLIVVWSLRKEALAPEIAEDGPLPWTPSWWPPHMTEAGIQRERQFQAGEWSIGTSAHCSRAEQRENLSPRAPEGTLASQC